MGAVPESYGYVRAAKYLGVAPWVLLERDDGRYWTAVAIAFENAESQAQADLSKRGAKR